MFEKMAKTHQEPKRKGKTSQSRVSFTDCAMALALLVTIAVLFYPQLQKPLTGNDDNDWFNEVSERNTIWKIIDYHSSRQIFTSYYNPAQTVIWRFLAANWGKDTFPYHIYCLIVHALVAMVVFLLAKEFIRERLFAFGAALAFTVYYPNYLTVGSLSEAITQSTGGLFFFLTLYFFIRFLKESDNSLYISSLVTFTIGVLVKEALFGFLIPVLACYYVIAERKRILKPQRRDLILVPYAAIMVPMLLIILVKSGSSAVVNDWGGFNFGIHMTYRFMDYIDFLATSVPVAPGIKTVVAYLLLLCAPFLAYHALRDRSIMFLSAGLALSISIFVYSNFRDIYSLYRYLYIPSGFWFILIYCVIDKIDDRSHRLAAASFAVSYSVIFNIAVILAK
jgi:hypothetical protein